MHRVFALALLPGLVLLAACQAKAPALSPDEILSRAAERAGAVKSFHFQLAHSGGRSPLVAGVELESAEGDIVPPGRLSTTLIAFVAGVALELKVVTVAGTTYMTNPLTGRFEALPTGVNPVAFFDPDGGVKAVLRGIKGAQPGSEDSIDGVPSYRLAGEVEASLLQAFVGSPAPGAVVDTEVWIGKTDFLVRQITFRGQVMQGDAVGVLRTLRLSRFDQAVAIEPPS